MLRNKQEEKLKYFRRLRAYQDTLEPNKIDYVPVEKPFFVGWDISITLSESGMRRRDAPDILAILDILGASAKQFTKSVRFIRYLRHFRYSVEATAGTYNYKHYRWSTHWYPYWYQTGLNAYYIDERKFEQVPLHLRHFFYEDKDSYYRKYVRHSVYRLSFMNAFPFYELIYKVEKSYANALGVPRGDDISESDMISTILSNAHYWSTKNGCSNGGESYCNHMSNIMHRRAWKQFCKSMKNSDFSDEAEEQSRKYLKNQKYKW